MDTDNLKIIRNIYLQKFYKMSILIYYIEKNKYILTEVKNLNNLLTDKHICLFFLQKTLITQANRSISKSLQKEKIKYSKERLIVCKMFILISCPLNAFLKKQNINVPTITTQHWTPARSLLKANYSHTENSPTCLLIFIMSQSDGQS